MLPGMEDPVHHHDRKTWTTKESKGSVPEFDITLTPDGLAWITCTRCTRAIGVTSKVVREYQTQTKPCFHCFKVSWIPQLPDEVRETNFLREYLSQE